MPIFTPFLQPFFEAFLVRKKKDVKKDGVVVKPLVSQLSFLSGILQTIFTCLLLHEHSFLSIIQLLEQWIYPKRDLLRELQTPGTQTATEESSHLSALCSCAFLCPYPAFSSLLFPAIHGQWAQEVSCFFWSFKGFYRFSLFNSMSLSLCFCSHSSQELGL